MAVANYLTTSALHEIVKYRDPNAQRGQGVAFQGTMRQHPYDGAKFLLITSPLEDDSHFYEFRKADVIDGRDVRQIVTDEGETLQIVEVIVRHGSFGIEMKPFEVR